MDEQTHSESHWVAGNGPENPFLTKTHGKKDARGTTESPRLANGKRGANTPLATTLAKKQAMKVPAALSQEAELPSEWLRA
jgi:hypothetical protein